MTVSSNITMTAIRKFRRVLIVAASLFRKQLNGSDSCFAAPACGVERAGPNQRARLAGRSYVRSVVGALNFDIERHEKPDAQKLVWRTSARRACQQGGHPGWQAILHHKAAPALSVGTGVHTNGAPGPNQPSRGWLAADKTNVFGSCSNNAARHPAQCRSGEYGCRA